MPLVLQGWLITFGIAPDAPETGYGWIQVGDKLQPSVNRVTRFVEKLALDRAQAMLASDDYGWNGRNGRMFLFMAHMSQRSALISNAQSRESQRVRLYRALIQPDTHALDLGLFQPHGLQTASTHS